MTLATSKYVYEGGVTCRNKVELKYVNKRVQQTRSICSFTKMEMLLDSSKAGQNVDDCMVAMSSCGQCKNRENNFFLCFVLLLF